MFLYLGLSNPVNITIPGVDKSSLQPIYGSDSNVKLSSNISSSDKTAGANFYAKPTKRRNSKYSSKRKIK